MKQNIVLTSLTLLILTSSCEKMSRQSAVPPADYRALVAAKDFLRSKGLDTTRYDVEIVQTKNYYIVLFGLEEGWVGGEPLVMVDKKNFIVVRFSDEQ